MDDLDPCHLHRTEEENEDHELQKPLWEKLWNSSQLTVDPEGKVAFYWMGVVAAAVIYNCAVIVLRVAFSELREYSGYQTVFFMMDAVCDTVYLLDIAIQARTGFRDNGCLVFHIPSVAKNYKERRHFPLDVISVLPLQTLYFVLNGASRMFPYCHFTDSRKLVPPLLRIVRLLKFRTVIQFFEISDSRTSNPNMLRAFKLSLFLWIVIHWIACIYYMISEYEGLGSNDWVYSNNEEDKALTRKYIRCTFWSMMTLTTIGERPSPVTDLEYVFTGMIFLIGVFVFAAVVGNVGDVISNMHAARQDFQSRMDHVKFFMQHRHVPDEIQDRVKRWAEYSWTRTQAIDETGLLQLLPDRLRADVAIHVYLETLKKVTIFEECEEGLLRELVLKLRPQIYSPGDYICRIGEIGREMYILNHGRVEILVPSSTEDKKTRVAILSPGNYFGEISLLKIDHGQNRRTADVRAVGYSELLCLSRKDLLSALVEYPDAKAMLEVQAKERILQTKGVGSKPGSRWSFLTKPTSKANVPEVFAEVMRQKGFQKLLSSKGNDVSELRNMVEDLRTMMSEKSTENVKQLTERCQMLEKECKQKDKVLLKRNNRIIKLETFLKMKGISTKDLENNQNAEKRSEKTKQSVRKRKHLEKPTKNEDETDKLSCRQTNSLDDSYACPLPSRTITTSFHAWSADAINHVTASNSEMPVVQDCVHDNGHSSRKSADNDDTFHLLNEFSNALSDDSLDSETSSAESDLNYDVF